VNKHLVDRGRKRRRVNKQLVDIMKHLVETLIRGKVKEILEIALEV